MSWHLFAVFLVKIFLPVQVDSLLLLWGFKYYCSHYGSLSHLLLYYCVYAVECVAGSICGFALSLVRMRVCGCSIPLFCMFFGSQDEWKWQKKCCKKLIVDFNLCFFPILHYNLAFVFQGTVGRRNTKLRNESVSFVYMRFFLCLTASFVCMLNIGISFSFIKLRSPTSYLCSAFLSIINLINKIGNKNRIINTRFSWRTWQNNACQSLLFTHAFLFLYVPLSG